jgi:hypothetical protein
MQAGYIFNLILFESDQYIVRLFALHRRGAPTESFDALFNKMKSILEAINGVT